MSEGDEPGQEKTEEPTERRLRKAREEGQTLTSKELSSLVTLIVGFMMLWWMGVNANSTLASWSELFNFSRIVREDIPLLDVLSEALGPPFLIILILTAPIIICVIISQMALGGLNFSPKAFMFKANRINPIQGFKRVFGIQSLVELSKSVLKVILLTAVVVIFFLFVLNEIVVLPGRTLGVALSQLSNYIPVYLFFVVSTLLVITAIDVSYQYYRHHQKLRMTPQEVKDDLKQTQGSPEVKARVRKLQLEASRASAEQSKSIDRVKDSNVVITNPMHFAVALSYDMEGTSAPITVAMGKGTTAIRIIKEAEKNEIYVFHNVYLARALFFTSKLNKEIESRLYSAVAVVLAYVFSFSDQLQNQENSPPDVDVPRDLRFDEFGKKL